MKMWVVFIAGLMLGGMFGVGAMCLCFAARQADDAAERNPPNKAERDTS